MIKYKLACKDCEITFDSWFASSKEFEKLKKKQFLVCHICNSKKVDKTLMAPSLRNKKKDIKKDFQLDRLSKMALEDPSTATNPKKMTIDDMKILYEYSLSGKLF